MTDQSRSPQPSQDAAQRPSGDWPYEHPGDGVNAPPAPSAPRSSLLPGRVSECPTCPPWVVRCAHWGGRVLVLGDATLLRAVPGYHFLKSPARYGVLSTSGFAACSCSEEHIVSLEDPIQTGCRYFKALRGALAEFQRRESLLLAQEPEA